MVEVNLTNQWEWVRAKQQWKISILLHYCQYACKRRIEVHQCFVSFCRLHSIIRENPASILYKSIVHIHILSLSFFLIWSAWSFSFDRTHGTRSIHMHLHSYIHTKWSHNQHWEKKKMRCTLKILRENKNNFDQISIII